MLKITEATTEQDINTYFAIRKQVFVIEQNVPEALEWDGLDKESRHYLLADEGKPCATLRTRQLDEKLKIERMAVLSECRGHGFGQQLLEYVIGIAKSDPEISKVVLSAQCHAIPFYQKLSFSVCSDIYLDADIEHQDMVLGVGS